MAKQQPKQSAAGTNVQQVKKQNQKAAQGQGEFASEQTNAQEVKKQNQKSQQSKK